MKLRRWLVVFALVLFGVCATGIGRTEIGSADSYPSHYLHAQNEVRTVSVSYFAHAPSVADKALDRKINGYLHSIKNANRYHVNIRTNSVGRHGDTAHIQTDTIILTRK